MPSFQKFLKKFYGKRILFLCHSKADLDSFASASAIATAFSKKFSATVGVPDSLTRQSKEIARKQKLSYILSPNLADYDAVVLVDFNSEEMLGSFAEEFYSCKKPLFALDHHKMSGKPLAKNFLNEAEKTSVSEIVYNFLKKSKISLTPKTALLLCFGIATDSNYFSVGSSETFAIFSNCLSKSKKSYSEILGILKTENPISARIASIRALKRSQLFKTEDFLIAFSEVNSFEASAANSLISLGADVSFAGSVDKGQIRISGRASSVLLEKGFDLAKHVFLPLAQLLKGSAGGHKGAAAFEGSGNLIEPVFEKCVTLSFDFLKKRLKQKEFKKLD